MSFSDYLAKCILSQYTVGHKLLDSRGNETGFSEATEQEISSLIKAELTSWFDRLCEGK